LRCTLACRPRRGLSTFRLPIVCRTLASSITLSLLTLSLLALSLLALSLLALSLLALSLLTLSLLTLSLLALSLLALSLLALSLLTLSLLTLSTRTAARLPIGRLRTGACRAALLAARFSVSSRTRRRFLRRALGTLTVVNVARPIILRSLQLGICRAFTRRLLAGPLLAAFASSLRLFRSCLAPLVRLVARGRCLARLLPIGRVTPRLPPMIENLLHRFAVVGSVGSH
jgi:hypothetical protein